MFYLCVFKVVMKLGKIILHFNFHHGFLIMYTIIVTHGKFDFGPAFTCRDTDRSNMNFKPISDTQGTFTCQNMFYFLQYRLRVDFVPTSRRDGAGGVQFRMCNINTA